MLHFAMAGFCLFFGCVHFSMWLADRTDRMMVELRGQTAALCPMAEHEVLAAVSRYLADGTLKRS